MNRALAVLSILVFTATVPSGVAAQTLSLQIHDGRVTLDARGVSIRQILDEWARVGQVTVINADALPSTPTTVLLTGVTEQSALATLLRDAGGYLLGPRQAAGPTEIDRIFVVAGGSQPRTTGAPAFAQTRAPQPQVTTFTVADTPQAEPDLSEPVVIVAPAGTQRQQPDNAAGGGRFGTVTPPGAASAASITQTGEPQPIRYQDALDENGNRLRAPSVPLNAEPADSPENQSAPVNPFGVTTGSATPGTISPAPKR